jgi:hypothetical protein
MYESDLSKIALLPAFQFLAKESLDMELSTTHADTVANTVEDSFLSVSEASSAPDVFADSNPDVLVETSDRDISIGSGVAFESTDSKTQSTVASNALTDSIILSTAKKNLSVSSAENFTLNSLLRDVKSAIKQEVLGLDITLKNDKLKVALLFNFVCLF